jgi:hypothetical protein
MFQFGRQGVLHSFPDGPPSDDIRPLAGMGLGFAEQEPNMATGVTASASFLLAVAA